MALEKVGVRLEPLGGEAIVREFRAIGDTGERELGRLPPAASRAGQALLGLEQRTVTGGARMRGALGQVGFQVQDMVVQLQAGTNPLTVFVQQGSQIAGAFGPAGAAIGTVASIAAIAAGALLGFGRDADNAKAASDALKASQEAMQGTMAATASSADELAASYRRATAEARALEAASLDVSITRGRESVASKRAELVDSLGDIATGVLGDRRRADTIRSLMTRNEELGFPPEELAADLRRDIDLVRQADAELKAIADGGDPTEPVLRLREILGISPEALDDTRRAADDAVNKAKEMVAELHAIGESEARRRLLAGTATKEDRDLLDRAGRSPDTGRALTAPSEAGAARNWLDESLTAIDATAATAAERIAAEQRQLESKLVDLRRDRDAVLAELSGTPETETMRREALSAEIGDLDKAETNYRAATDRRIAAIQDAARREAETRARALATRERQDDRPPLLDQAGARRVAGLQLQTEELQRLDAANRQGAAAYRQAQIAIEGEREARAVLTGATQAQIAAIRQQLGLPVTATQQEIVVAVKAEVAERSALEDKIKATTSAREREAVVVDLRVKGGYEGLVAGLRAVSKETGDTAANVSQAVTGSFSSLEEGLLQSITQAEAGLEGLAATGKRVALSIAEDFARLAIRQSITGPLSSALFSAFSRLYGAENAAVSSGAGISADRLHEGGIAGAAARKAIVDPALFATAPRFHRGGLAHDEVPAVLLKGERVLSPQQTREYDEGPPTPSLRAARSTVNVAVPLDVKVIDQRTVAPGAAAGSGISVSERPGPDGRRMIEVMVRDVIASGAADPAMRSRYGAEPSRSRIGR